MGLEMLSLESQVSTGYPSSSKSTNSFRRFVLLVLECIISLRAYGLIKSLDRWVSSGVLSCISRINRMCRWITFPLTRTDSTSA
jgi:hypothetical protein